MKLRQKLAMVLATAMVVTAVPVVTYAESTNKITHTISSVEGTIADQDTGLKLIMDFGNSINPNGTTFYLEAKDFEFQQALYNDLQLNLDAATEAATDAVKGTDVTNLDLVSNASDVKIESVNGFVYDGKKVDKVKVTVSYTEKAKSTERKEKDVQITKADFVNLNTQAEKVITEVEEALKGKLEISGDGEDLQNGGFTSPAALKSTLNYSTGTVEIVYLSSDELRVTVTPGKGDRQGTKVAIPILGKVKTGTPSVSVRAYDSDATAGTYMLTRENVEDGKRIGVKVADATPITVDGGELAAVTLTEKEEGTLYNATTAGRTVTFTLPNSSDLVFSKESVQEKSILLTGKAAFAPNKDQKVSDLEGADVTVEKEGKVLKLVLPTERVATTTTGEWIVKGIQVEPEDVRDEATTGDVNVTISGDMVKEEKFKMAVVTEFDQTLTAKEVVELYSGKGSKEVVVTLKENVKESLDDKRWAYFELTDGAYIKADADHMNDGKLSNIEMEKIVKVNINGDDVTKYDENMIQPIQDKDGNITGFKVQFEYKDDDKNAEGYLDQDKANTIKFTFNVQADSQTTGKVELKAESKAFEVDPVQIANVTAPIEVSFDATTVKVGLEKQALGKITVKEVAEGMLEKGELVIDTDEEGIKFVSSAKDIKVTTPEGSTLKVTVDRVTKDGGVVLNVERQSKEASEFTIEGIVADIDRTVPEGDIAVEVYGDSLRAFDGVWGDSKYNEKDGHKAGNDFVYEDNKTEEFDAPHKFVKDGYIVVGTKNTEDLPSAAKAKEIILTVNSTEYTVNGEAKTADAAAFIDANNRTMVPVKFVAEEFGRIEFGTINGVGTVTVFKDGDVLQFQNGSNVMNKNGIAIPMDTKTVIQKGRTYVPFKYVAQGLGINYSFDNATKSITFTNQEK